MLAKLANVQAAREIRNTLERSRAPVAAVLTIVVELITVAIASRGKKDALTVLAGHSVTFVTVLSRPDSGAVVF